MRQPGDIATATWGQTDCKHKHKEEKKKTKTLETEARSVDYIKHLQLPLPQSTQCFLAVLKVYSLGDTL